jgi:hypothetical protein
MWGVVSGTGFSLAKDEPTLSSEVQKGKEMGRECLRCEQAAFYDG